MDAKKIIGFTETITVYGNDGRKKKVVARIDSGATKSSIDARTAANLKLGPIVKVIHVNSAHGSTLRPAIETEIKLGGKRLKGSFSIADRGHMKYKVLLGQNILKRGRFLIDTAKK